MWLIKPQKKWNIISDYEQVIENIKRKWVQELRITVHVK
jgi:hypothetical protein